MRLFYLPIALAFVLFLPHNTYSQIINIDEARQTAIKAFGEVLLKDSKSISLEEEFYIKEIDSQPVLYIFNETNGGFVIVSAENRIYPILGYSPANAIPVDEIFWSPEFRYWMETFWNQIDYLRKNNLPALPEVVQMRSKIQNNQPLGLMPSKDVAPLLATTWNQGCGYNALCPVDGAGPCGHVYTGCVATAMAQVIRYMQHPVHGIGSHCYTHYVYGEQCADFAAATYDYSIMTNGSGNAEVAELMYHCGVSVNMGYSPTGSGAYSHQVVTAFSDYFDYKNSVILSKTSYTDNNWHRILRNEIDNNRPFYYAGSGSSGGHAFVFDGYQGLDYFHINWGWGGSQNGYFYCNDLTPGSYDFTSSQRAIVGAIPSPLFTNLDCSSATGLLCATPVSQNLSTGINYINSYKNTYPATPGKELVYHFTTTLPGRIRVKITNSSEGSLYAFLLSHPHQDSLITYGTDGFILDNTLPGTYYLAVESSSAAEPTFDIEVICPTIDADLIINDGSVTPDFFESLQPNVQFNSTVKNIGNTAAAANVINYYLSDDMVYNAGVDVFLGTDVVPGLAPGVSANIQTILTMPAGLTSGSKNIVFVADEANTVPEADNQNEYFTWATIPDPGLLDCSSAVSLTNGVWYYNNTQTNGTNNLQDYWPAMDQTAPEIVHSFTATYSGLARISFTEKNAGEMKCMTFPLCNENTWLSSVWFANITDTLGTDEFYVNAGTEYYVVVDSKLPVQGAYGVKIDLPAECPIPEIEYWGELNLCDGEPLPNFWTFWSYPNYQWYKNGVAIPGEINSNFMPADAGTYYVEVVENGCSGQSAPVTINISYPPDTATIAALTTTEFCSGNSVVLQLSNTVSHPMQWTLNGTDIPGAVSSSITATEPGEYHLTTINGFCTVQSTNSIDVTVNPLPADLGEPVPFPSDTIEFYYSFNTDSYDEINNYYFNCWSFMPADDRNGNFWKARDFTSEDVMGYSSHYYPIPQEFTMNVWFKTTTTEGGMISSFADNPWGPTNQDAVIYMSNDGKIHFYLNNGGTPAELTSVQSYNDGNWHSVLIAHETGMLMEIDGGDEFIQIATPVTHLSFSGYWAFGGSIVPANVSSMPTSQYFDGVLDDIVCLNEANYQLRNYIDVFPELDLDIIGDTAVCNNTLASFTVSNSQFNVEYKVWNNTASAWHAAPATGTGGDITIGGAAITQSTNFTIYATNLETGCENILDTVLHISVYPSLAPAISITSDGLSPECAGTEINFTAGISNSGSNPIIEWFVDEADQNNNSTAYTYNGLSLSDTITAVVYSDYLCSTLDSAISNQIIIDFTPLVTPSANISVSPATLVCYGDTVNFSATAVNGGASPVYQWYRDGMAVGTNSDIYETDDFTDNEEIYVVITSDIACVTSATDESNHLFTDVSVPPAASMALTGGYCLGEEICMEYNGSTTGLSSVEWEVSDGGPVINFTGAGPHCITPSGSVIQILVTTYNSDGCHDTTSFINNALGPVPAINIYDTIYHCPMAAATYEAPAGYVTYNWSNDMTGTEFSSFADGLYYLTVTNSSNCDNTDSILVIGYDDHGFAWPSDTTICIDDTLVLNPGTGYAYIDYSWHIGLTGTSTDEEVSIYYTGENPMPVLLTTEDEHCTYSDSISVIFDICSFVDGLNGQGYQVFPNPATDNIYIKTDFKVQQIMIIDVTGKIITSNYESGNSYVIDIQNLSDGMYYLMFTDNAGKVIRTKFIKH